MPQENTAIAAILARYQHWMQSIRERDLEAILDIYADNATYMPPGKPAFSGKQALREVWAGYLQREDFVASYVPTLHLCDAGDMAYDIGRYRIAMKKEGLPVSFEESTSWSGSASTGAGRRWSTWTTTTGRPCREPRLPSAASGGDPGVDQSPINACNSIRLAGAGSASAGTAR